MELRVLSYFLMVAREENITRAAERLHITQPTLSRQLMQLEAELGVKLFRRGKHNVMLTQDGMLLKRRAQEIVNLAEKTAQDFSVHDEELTGEISIGSGESLSMTYLAQKLAAFQALHPHVHFHLYSGNADDIKERIENGLLDLGLLVEPVDIARYAFYRMQAKEEWGVLVREDSPLAQKKAVTPQDLPAYPLLVPGRAMVQNEVSGWFGGKDDTLNVVMTFNLLYNAAEMVRAGLGAALTLRLNCSYEGLRFVPLAPRLELGTVLVWKKNQVYAPALTALIELIKK